MDDVHDKLEFHVSHLRAFRGQIDACKPTQAEAEALDKAGITNMRTRSYIIWRRSCLVVASPFVSTSLIMGLVALRDTFSGEDTALNGLGQLLAVLPAIDDIFMSVGMSISMHMWTKSSLSMQSLLLGWLISTVLPLLPALFPLEMLIKEDDLEAFNQQEDADAILLLLKLTLAIGYAIELLPIVVSLPGGAVRGALRILGLLPSSTLPGWILMVAAPFYSLLVCIALVVIIQVAGDSLLFFGSLFLVASPLVYVVRGKLFVLDKNNAEVDERVYQFKMTQRLSAALTTVGLLILLIWAFTAESNGIRVLGHRRNKDATYFQTYGGGIRMVFEMIGRLLVTTVLFSDIVLAMSISHWREERGMEKQENSEADMIQFNTLVFGTWPVGHPPETTPDMGELSPMAPVFCTVVEPTERVEGDDYSSLGPHPCDDEKSDLSV